MSYTDVNNDNHKPGNCYNHGNEVNKNKAALWKHSQTDMGRSTEMLQKCDTQMRQAKACQDQPLPGAAQAATRATTGHMHRGRV